jgi:Lon protease-like protein
MDEADRVERELGRLPIFPLPGAVLLPFTLIPLHVFEPRYRKMIRDCAQGAGVLALANIPEEALRAGEPAPKVLPVLGVGVLARVEPLPDGRSNILLRGVLRARIVEELPSAEPYRIVRAERLRDEVGIAERERDAAESLRRLVLALCAARPGPASGALAQMAARDAPAGELADAVAGALVESAEERQALLAELSPERRLIRLGTALASALAQTANASSPRN